MSLISGVHGLPALLASLPAHYGRDQRWQQKGIAVATDRYTLQTPNRLTININNNGYVLTSQQNIDLSVAANWDSIATDYTVAAARAGKDFYIYACVPVSGTVPVIVLSANSTVPAGYDANNSRKIGGFHCLCASVGTISGHSLTGFVIGDILPDSIWDLRWRAKCSNEGMVYDQKSGLWVDIYLASGTGVSTASVFSGTISDSRDWMSFVDDGLAVGKRLLHDHEFQGIAAGSNEETNISGSADPVTTGGHVNTAGRRMISNVGCEDCCGVMWQWLLDQSYQFDAGVLSIITGAATLAITHAASPGGNPIYVKFSLDGSPYLACNMATDAVDKWLTFGSAYTLLIKHDANAATGGYQVYFDEDATQPSRLLAALPGLKDVYILTSNPRDTLKITYNAAPGTPGVAISYDDGSDERLEFTSPTAANGTLDLALLTFVDPTWTFYDLPGSKGSLYKQGSYGDVKLVAGADWGRGSASGSRARGAADCRWNTSSGIGGRFAAEPRGAET
jgi:hypothetical protein